MALSAKMQAFINEYLIDFNATRAAERAGYKGSEATLASTGWENLRKPEIKAAIKQRLQEKAMLADEVLMRLAEQARGSMADFVRFDAEGNVIPDLQTAAFMGKLHLVKRLKIKQRTYSIGDDEPIPVTETTTEFELYDAQAANALLGKHHGLFVERTEHTGANGGPIQVDDKKVRVNVYIPDNGRDRN